MKSKGAAAKTKKKLKAVKRTAGTKAAKKTQRSKKKSTGSKRPAPISTPRRKKRVGVSTESEIRRENRNTRRDAAGESDSRWSGDLQGLSRAEQADSESVDELVDEGNVFEAGAVAGVEAADDADEQEVHTHELPEDDVPEEYLDEN